VQVDEALVQLHLKAVKGVGTVTYGARKKKGKG
jgi:hypothetical protein